MQEIFNSKTAESFHLDEYDYVIDAIDSLKDKIELLVYGSGKAFEHTRLYSSMWAALKVDPTQVRVSELWDVNGCPLASMMCKKMHRTKRFPGRKIQCVWSPEVLPNLGQARSCGTETCMCPKAQSGDGRADLPNHEWCTSKAQINGFMSHITAIFGLTLAGLIIQDIYRQ